jgi:hypothetical protein
MGGEIHFVSSMKKRIDILGGPTEQARVIEILAGVSIISL